MVNLFEIIFYLYLALLASTSTRLILISGLNRSHCPSLSPLPTNHCSDVEKRKTVCNIAENILQGCRITKLTLFPRRTRLLALFLT